MCVENVSGDMGDDHVGRNRQDAIDLVTRLHATGVVAFESLMNRVERVEIVHGRP